MRCDVDKSTHWWCVSIGVAAEDGGWRTTGRSEPALVDQELYFPGVGTAGGLVTVYWEGAVRVTGDSTGVGYVELTDYAPR